MPREIVTLHCGQCGNQVGLEFWQRMIAEHGIQPDGAAGELLLEDRKDVFFYQSSGGRFVPRALLLDLEPGVVQSITSASPLQRLFNSESVFVPREMEGAGNIWASGYRQAQTHLEAILERVDREVEGSDSLSGFTLTHSVAGGTGSGMGSLLLEALKERFPRKLLQTYSVFPARDASDVVVQPYNAVLTLQRLAEHADAVTVLDNGALDAAVRRAQRPQHSFDQANRLIARVACAASQALRFPGFMLGELHSLVGCLVPSPRLHFLVAKFAPV